jgi:2-methylisocitrate lyase-like PEP mutase family enzyme
MRDGRSSKAEARSSKFELYNSSSDSSESWSGAAKVIVTQNDKAKAFRSLHEGPGTFVIPNPWDVDSSRILAAMGFKALATTSAGFAFSLGRRDGEGLVTRDEALAHARLIVMASDLPVSADLENCFGHAPEVVAETIRLAGEAGLVGASVEDASGDPSHPIYDHRHAVERVAAAVEAARTLPFPFTLTARAENFLHDRADLDDTVRRLQAFAAAGADVLYAPGLSTLEQARTICASVSPRPVNVLAAGKGSPFTLSNLTAIGVRRISLGAALYRTAMGGFFRAAREIMEDGTFTFGEQAATFAEVSSFMKGR